MPTKTGSTIAISIDKGDGTPVLSFSEIPWFPGVTALQAMIVAQAMYPDSFSFKINYHSRFGAFVESIDDVAQAGEKIWLLKVAGKTSSFGASEAIVIEEPTGMNVDIEWLFQTHP